MGQIWVWRQGWSRSTALCGCEWGGVTGISNLWGVEDMHIKIKADGVEAWDFNVSHLFLNTDVPIVDYEVQVVEVMYWGHWILCCPLHMCPTLSFIVVHKG